jgi:hypothetical protein
METSYKFTLPFDIVPFAYRTHGHNLAKVISGYVIRDEEWIEIGRMSPKQPQVMLSKKKRTFTNNRLFFSFQMFYDTSVQDFVITRNDILASRCAMNSMSKTEKTFMGSKISYF